MPEHLSLRSLLRLTAIKFLSWTPIKFMIIQQQMILNLSLPVILSSCLIQFYYFDKNQHMGTSMTLPEHVEAQLAVRKIKQNHEKPKQPSIKANIPKREVIYMGKIDRKKEQPNEQSPRTEKEKSSKSESKESSYKLQSQMKPEQEMKNHKLPLDSVEFNVQSSSEQKELQLATPPLSAFVRSAPGSVVWDHLSLQGKKSFKHASSMLKPSFSNLAQAYKNRQSEGLKLPLLSQNCPQQQPGDDKKSPSSTMSYYSHINSHLSTISKQKQNRQTERYRVSTLTQNTRRLKYVCQEEHPAQNKRARINIQERNEQMNGR